MVPSLLSKDFRRWQSPVSGLSDARCEGSSGTSWVSWCTCSHPGSQPTSCVAGRCVAGGAPSLALGPRLPKDWPALPSGMTVTGMLRGIWLSFKGQAFMGFRALYLPPSSDGMFVYFVAFCAAGKYESKPAELTFSLSVLALHSNVWATNK